MATLTAQELAKSDADSWLRTLDGEIVDEGAFSTLAGADGYFVRVDGDNEGLPTTILVVSIVGPDRTAKIFIETYMADVLELVFATPLLVALQTVEFAPVDDGEMTSGSVENGFFTRGTVSATVPSEWTPLVSDAETREMANTIEAEAYGIWIFDGTMVTGTTSGLFLVIPLVEGRGTIDEFRDEFGEVGTITTKADGSVEVVSYDEIALPNGATGARACTIVTRNTVEIPGEVCMYSLAWGEYLLVGTVQAITLEEWALEDAEAFLGTFRTNATS